MEGTPLWACSRCRFHPNAARSSVKQQGRDRGRALPTKTINRRAYGFFVVSFIVVSFIAESIFMAESIFAAVSAGAGAMAGAAVVSTGVSSFVVQAARASTAATRARRFI